MNPKRTYSALTPQQQQLATEYEARARSLAYRMYYHSGQIGDVEDYIETGYTALIAAAALFNPDRGLQFNTLLGIALKRRLWHLRAEITRKKRVHRCVRFSDLERDEMPSLDPVDRRGYQPDRSVICAEVLGIVEARLSPYQWDLLHARFVEGESLWSLGVRLKVTKRCVREQIDDALQQARRLVIA